MPTLSPLLGLLIYAGIIAVGLILIFAQMKLFSIAKDVRSIREIIEKPPQHKGD